jgi:hypothetical protein
LSSTVQSTFSSLPVSGTASRSSQSSSTVPSSAVQSTISTLSRSASLNSDSSSAFSSHSSEQAFAAYENTENKPKNTFIFNRPKKPRSVPPVPPKMGQAEHVYHHEIGRRREKSSSDIRDDPID